MKGEFTRAEIRQQPGLLVKIFDLIKSKKEEVQSFLELVFSVDDVQMVLTGAGSSAFVGETLVGLSLHYKKKMSRAIATTDILTNPELHFDKTKRTLLVSFARSGDSPESLGVINVVNDFCQDVFHLIITCNKDGKLANLSLGDNACVVLLPPETNDKSLAMTSSFTGMMLAYILIVKIDQLSKEEKRVKQVAEWIQIIFDKYDKQISKLAKLNFERAVFLGTGYMQAIARESHLKLQELTDGHVICKHDSYLGFRHGPKVVINDKTLIVYLISNDSNSNKYEYDLIKQINRENKGLAQVVLAANTINISNIDFDVKIEYDCPDLKGGNEYLSIAHVVFAQIFGFYKALELGLDPDNPSVSGAISRVVKDVNIY